MQEFLKNLKGKTQTQKVLWYLETFGSITNLQCHELLGIRHAPSVIRDLRKKFLKDGSDFEIVNKHKKGCNRFDEPCWWDEYVLIKKGQI